MWKGVLTISIAMAVHLTAAQEAETSPEVYSAPPNDECVVDFKKLTDAIRRVVVLEESALSSKYQLLLIESLPPTLGQENRLCAYTRASSVDSVYGTEVSNAKTQTERFTPVGESSENWDLLQINGAPPSVEELEIYELQEVAAVRELRPPPWQLEQELPMHHLMEANLMSDQTTVVYDGGFNATPQEMWPDAEEQTSDQELEFNLTVIVDAKQGSLLRYYVELQAPIEFNEISRLDRYEVDYQWEHDEAVGDSILKHSRVFVQGRSYLSDFRTETTSTTSAFYCPSERPEVDQVEPPPCMEGLIGEPVDTVPNELESTLLEPSGLRSHDTLGP